MVFGRAAAFLVPNVPHGAKWPKGLSRAQVRPLSHTKEKAIPQSPKAIQATPEGKQFQENIKRAKSALKVCGLPP